MPPEHVPMLKTIDLVQTPQMVRQRSQTTMGSAALQPGQLIQGDSKQIKSKVAKVTDSPPPEVTEFCS